MSDRSRRRIAPLLIFTAAMALRASLVDRQGLWVDEVFSLAMATGHSLEHSAAKAEPGLGDYVESPDPLPPSAYRAYAEHDDPPAGPDRVIRAVLRSDTNPPLYYLLLYAWTRALGTTDASLRLFSVFCSAVCLPLLWKLGKQLGGRRTALTALTLFAFAPLSVYYSVEGRMYSLLWLATLTSAAATRRLYREGTTSSACGLWVVACVGGLLTHYFFAFVWGAFVLWLMLFPGRARRGAVIAAIVAVGLLAAPWYVRLPESLSGWRVTGGWLETRPADYKPVQTLVKLAWSYVRGTGVWWAPSRRSIGWLVHALVLVPIAAALVLAGWQRLTRPRVLLLWSWLAAALLGTQVFDLLRGTYTVSVPRYASAGMPAAFLLIALVLRSVRRPLAWALLASIVIAWLPGNVKMFLGDTRAYEPFRAVGRLLASRVHASDLVLVHSIPSGVIGVARYWRPDEEASQRGAALASWVGQLGVRRCPEDLVNLARGRSRIFLVRIHDVNQAAPEEDWLRAHARLVSTDDVLYAIISTFAPSEGARFFEGETDKNPEEKP